MTRKMKTEKNEIEEFVIFNNNFMRPYYDAGDIMLHTLLNRTKSKIHSEKDKNIIYSKTIDILSKLHHDLKSMFDKMELDHIVNVKLKDAKSSPVFKAADFDINLIYDIIKVIKNFKNQFLIDDSSEQKTSESHEKPG